MSIPPLNLGPFTLLFANSGSLLNIFHFSEMTYFKKLTSSQFILCLLLRSLAQYIARKQTLAFTAFNLFGLIAEFYGWYAASCGRSGPASIRGFTQGNHASKSPLRVILPPSLRLYPYPSTYFVGFAPLTTGNSLVRADPGKEITRVTLRR